ncbi:putative P-type ATPase [Choanephora cucurbitarum]|nr:putative P-type ATPase [Choanephora cucurbitarum]
MSKNPSAGERAVYGTSSVESEANEHISTKSITSRRDSAAPLVHTPPTQVEFGADPLEVGSLDKNSRQKKTAISGSYSQRPHMGLIRRRRNSESEVNSESETDGELTELNSSDEQSDMDDSDSDHSHLDDDLTEHRANDVRISGMSDIPTDTRNEQVLLLEEEDVQIRIIGYKYSSLHLMLYRICCILSLGFVWLVCRWVPSWHIAWTGVKVPLKDAEWLVFKSPYNEIEIIRPVRNWYNGSIGSIFSYDQVKEEIPRLLLNSDQVKSMLDMDKQLSQLMLVEYRYIRLAYHPVLHKFLIVGFWKDQSWNSSKNFKTGLSSDKHHARLSVFGPNLINIREKPTTKLLTDEVLNPFYVFQIGSILLWCMDDYYYYAFCIFIISAFSIVSTLLETKQTMKRMKDMSFFECSVRVFREGSWQNVSSVELVPGDLIDIANVHTVPCDAMLVSGDCILNESMLTGESVPVSKAPITDVTLRKMNLSCSGIPAEISKHFLFMGTNMVRVRGGDNVSLATAIVVRTGFNTAKGALVRSMLFPKPNSFKFYRDSFRFIGVLSVIALIGFLISSVNFIRLGIDSTTMVLRALDLITIVVPPALPATLSIGTSFAISRLKKLGIFCISPPRVNIGGKIDCMCFDKTGTLTEDGLDIHGIRAVKTTSDGRKLFDEECKSVGHVDPNNDMDEHTTQAKVLQTMTTCHSLKIVNGELLGDPLDLKMFEFTQWELEESGGATSTGLKPTSELAALQAKKSAKVGIMPTVVRPPGGRRDIDIQPEHAAPPVEFGIIHTFEFVSALRRMSVIVRRLASPTMEIFVKGAPEVMKDICTPESMPEDYQERLYKYTHSGYRVIACASRKLVGVKWHKLHKLKRDEMETGLTFLGFIVFENKLKPRTTAAITTLRNANIRQIMCTGDNVLTAVSVARECGLIDSSAEIYIPRFLKGSSTEEDSELCWESVLQEGSELSPTTLQPRSRMFSNDNPYVQFQEYYLAITGEAFRWMVDHAETECLYRMLVKGAIYARMSPDEKQELVVQLQEIGYCVGFCGDGANDCGALKAGDIGISLSEAEASVAAPFTSNTMDIECVIDVIKEGRAALVTSFSCFKYMALYSLIQFTSVTLLYAFGSNLGDFQFLYIDLFLILPIAVYMGYTAAWPSLHKRRPTASLVSKKVLTSLIGQIMINSGFQMVAYWAVHHQSWYTPPVFDPDGENIICLENTVLFLISSYQYMLVAVVFSVGPPFRQPIWTNGRLVLTLSVLVGLTSWFVLLPPSFVLDIMELEVLPMSFRLFILFLAGLNLAVSLLSEKYLFNQLSEMLSRLETKARFSRSSYIPVESKSDKIYQRVMDEMGIQGN